MTTEKEQRLSDMPLQQRDRMVAQVWEFLTERGYAIVAPAGTHRLQSPPFPRRCTCGWEPGLGESVMRAFDQHLRDVSLPPGQTS